MQPFGVEALIFVLKVRILRLLFLWHKEKTRTNTGSLREGAVAERLRESTRLIFFCCFRFWRKMRDFQISRTLSYHRKSKTKSRICKRKYKKSKGTKPRLSAAFQSRGLLPSRLRVTPSSRRKATVDALRCRRRKMCGFFLGG